MGGGTLGGGRLTSHEIRASWMVTCGLSRTCPWFLFQLILHFGHDICPDYLCFWLGVLYLQVNGHIQERSSTKYMHTILLMAEILHQFIGSLSHFS